MANSPKSDDVEILPKVWERFERAVDAVVKGGPQHKPKKSSGKVKDANDTDNQRERGNSCSDDSRD